MHLDAEQIERLLHAELAPERQAPLRAHLRECVRCARRLAVAAREEEEIFAALRHLDHPVPPVTVHGIARRASPVRRVRRRVAAGVALALATSSVLYAIPGAPLHELLRGSAARRVPAERAQPAPAAPAAPPVLPEPPHAAGVAVVPGTAFRVVFAAAQERGQLLVRRVDAAELTVRAIGESVPFDLAVDRLTVDNEGASADYEILLPRRAPRIQILIGTSVVLWQDERGVRAGVESDVEGRYRLAMRPDG